MPPKEQKILKLVAPAPVWNHYKQFPISAIREYGQKLRAWWERRPLKNGKVRNDKERPFT